VLEKSFQLLEFTAAAKAASHSSGFTARLEAAPFQSKTYF